MYSSSPYLDASGLSTVLIRFSYGTYLRMLRMLRFLNIYFGIILIITFNLSHTFSQPDLEVLWVLSF